MVTSSTTPRSFALSAPVDDRAEAELTVERRHFFDVRRSARGLAWENRLDPRQENVALAIAQTHGVPDIVSRVLAARGVGLEDAVRFLDPTIRDLMPDPSSLTDMDEAAGRIAAAILNREPIAVFGDYDVDGACSSALMKRYLDHFGVPAEIYIPDRIFEGYGPNPDAMRNLVERGAKLVVTVDCGTNSASSIDAANAAGAQVVVLDHHQVGGPLPAAVAVVNPNREDDLSGQGHLCAAGVVFLTLVRVSRLLRAKGQADLPDLLAMLDLVGLATVCDVVPLTGINRAFVVKGLLAARRLGNLGIAALARVAKIGEPLNVFHLGFVIGPRINAGGRIGDAALGSKLLACDDPVEANAIAETLDRLNQERQALEASMLLAAKAQADAELTHGEGPGILVATSDAWHPGIVGLLASRLKDYTRRPSFAISFGADGIGTGSGRSVPGFDLGRLVRDAVEAGILIKGGGHAMAAGVSLHRDKLGELRALFEQRSAEQIKELRDGETVKIDAALSAEGARFELLDALETAGPFGAGHSQPVLALPRHRILDVRTVGNGHLRLQLASEMGARLQAMVFRAANTDLGNFLATARGETVHVAGTLGSNYWNGSRSVQFRIIDAAKS